MTYTPDEDKIHWRGYLIGMVVGAVLGSTVLHPTPRETQAPIRPIEVVQQDRNSDGLDDIVQKFAGRKESVLYAHRTPEGKIEYQAQK